MKLTHSNSGINELCNITYWPSSISQKWMAAGEVIYNFIMAQTHDGPVFALKSVLDLITQINTSGQLSPYYYKLIDFEVWLNRCSNLSEAAILLVKQYLLGQKLSAQAGIHLLYNSHAPTVNRPIIVTAHPYPDADAATAAFIAWSSFFYTNKYTATILSFPQGIPNYSTKEMFESLFGDNALSIMTTKSPKPYIPVLALPWKPMASDNVSSTNKEDIIPIDYDWSTASALFADKDILVVGIKEMDGTLDPIGILELSAFDSTYACDIFLCDHNNLADCGADKSYINLVGIVDHHQISMPNTMFPCYIKNDATQSCATLLAEPIILAQDITEQHADKSANNVSWIHPDRSLLDNKLLIYAILDDTDMLDRVHFKDLWITARLIEKIYNISILQIEDMLSISTTRLLQQIQQTQTFTKFVEWIDEIKSRAINKMLDDFMKSPTVNDALISDVKILNKGKVIVRQVKLYKQNEQLFLFNKDDIIQGWLEHSKNHASIHHSECHILMINYMDINNSKDNLQDLFFIWQPPSSHKLFGADFLISFLQYKQYNSSIIQIWLNSKNPLPYNKTLSLEQELSLLYPNVTEQNLGYTGPNAIIEALPGVLTSRKNVISPFIKNVIVSENIHAI